MLVMVCEILLSYQSAKIAPPPNFPAMHAIWYCAVRVQSPCPWVSQCGGEWCLNSKTDSLNATKPIVLYNMWDCVGAYALCTLNFELG